MKKVKYWSQSVNIELVETEGYCLFPLLKSSHWAFHSTTWLMMFPKHCCLQWQSFAFFLAPRFPTSLLQSGTHTGDYFIRGAFLFMPLDGFLFTLQAANFVINISGNTQWHFKWNTNEKTLLFLATVSPQIWKEITIKLPKSHLSFFKLPQLSLFCQTLYFYPFGAKVGRKLKHDTFRENHSLRHRKELLPLVLVTYFCFVGSCHCECVNPCCTNAISGS